MVDRIKFVNRFDFFNKVEEPEWIRKQISRMFFWLQSKAGIHHLSLRQNSTKSIRESAIPNRCNRGSSTATCPYSALIAHQPFDEKLTSKHSIRSIIDTENILTENVREYEMEDQDVEINLYDSGDEDESDYSSSESDSITDAEQEMQNTIPVKKTRTRGLTRLPKLKTEYTDSGGKKRIVKFDELGRFSGKHRAQFISFLGDLVREKVGVSVLTWKEVKKEVRDKLWEEITRYFEIDESRRKSVMNRLGILLRNFRRKVYARYILPNIGKPTKLAKIPRRYRTILLNQEHWEKFVQHTQSDKFKDVSEKTKVARSKSLYQHRMGRGGYTALREKLVKNKVLKKDEMPARSFMWCKGHENKEGELENANLKPMADKLIDHEKRINDGSLKLDPGTDAITLVFGKEHGGFLKGVGTGVTPSRYFNVPRTKGSSKEEVAELRLELQNERLEHQKKDEQLKELSTQVTEQSKTLNLVLAHLASQGMTVPSLPSSTNVSPTQVIPVDKNVGCKANTNTIATKVLTKEFVTHGFVKTNKKSVGSKTSTTNLETPSTIHSQPKAQDTQSTNVPQTMQCTLAYPNVRNVVARGTIYLSSEKQTIHGVPLQDDCFKVSIDEVIKGASFLPYETSDHKTVGEAHKSFVAWPRYLVKCDSKVPHTTPTQNNEPNSKKRKKGYITRDAIFKHARNTTNKIRE